jgi:predicted amidohydrolase YtcJ
MADAALVITGTLLTVDEERPTAEALAVADGRIVAVGNRSDLAGLIGAAWQLFSDDEIGSLAVGKYADLVVLSADPRTVPPEQAIYLTGRQVYRQ